MDRRKQMRKSKEIEQRLVTLQIKYDALNAVLARIQLEVHTLKTQQAITQGDWHVPSTYTK
jgi:hypothetical protein